MMLFHQVERAPRDPERESEFSPDPRCGLGFRGAVRTADPTEKRLQAPLNTYIPKALSRSGRSVTTGETLRCHTPFPRR
jgi:hypothetical protein